MLVVVATFHTLDIMWHHTARTFSVLALFDLRNTIFKLGLVWNIESKNSNTTPRCYNSINVQCLAKM